MSSKQFDFISGLLYQEYRDKSTLQEIETRRQQDAEIQGGADGCPSSEEAPEEDEGEEEEGDWQGRWVRHLQPLPLQEAVRRVASRHEAAAGTQPREPGGDTHWAPVPTASHASWSPRPPATFPG